jgi:dTDP-4-dehydrorhamnose reductase
VAGHEILPLGRPVLDLAQPESVVPAILGARPDLVISAAAYTAVDKAESEPELARAINGVGAGKVAEAAAQANVPVIQVSTDYVFDGSNAAPYAESDPTAPLGVYGATKLEGERRVAAATGNHAIVRVAWIYSPVGANFMKTMLRLAESRDSVRVVADQRGGPTSALDIAAALLRMGERLGGDPAPTLRGIFHMPPAGEATWADFAEAIFRAAAKRGRPPCRVEHITTADYPTPARRPANSRLSGDKLRSVYGIALPHWTESLESCVGRLLAPVADARGAA